MKKSFVPFVGTFAAAVLSASAATAQPAMPAQGSEAAKLREARAIIAIMFPPAQRQQMMDKLLSDMTRPMRQGMSLDQLTDPGLKSLVEHFLDTMLEQERPLVRKHMPAIIDAMSIPYTHEFSLAELSDIHRFAETPTGGHYLSKSLAIVGDPAVMNVNKEIAAESQQFVTLKIGELKDQVIAYLKAHPDVAAKLKAEHDAATK